MINKKKIICCIIACTIFLSVIFCSCSFNEDSIISKAVTFIENHKHRDYIASDETFKAYKQGGEFEITVTQVQVYDSYDESNLPTDAKIGVYSEKNPDDDCVFFLVSMDIKCMKEMEIYSEYEDETDKLFNVGNFSIYPKNNYSGGRIADCVCYFSDSYDRDSLNGKYSYGFLIDEGETKNVCIGIIAKQESTQNGNTVLANDTLFFDENGNEFSVLLEVDI